MEGRLRHTLQTWSDSRRDVETAYQLFEELRVPTLKISRIAEYLRLYRDFEDVRYDPTKMGLKRLTRLMHAAMEVDQLILIATAAGLHVDTWRGRLEPLISGSAFPLEAKHDSKARDHQYECFIAAAAQLAGYEVAFDEPDVIISRNGLGVGLAAKRPRHAATLLKNCRRAARQIRTFGGEGIVALDVTTALFTDFSVITNDATGAKDAVAAKLYNFVENRAPNIRAECADIPVAGILVTAYAPALVHADPRTTPTLYTTKVWSAVHIAQATTDHTRWFLDFVNASHAATFRSGPPGA